MITRSSACFDPARSSLLDQNSKPYLHCSSRVEMEGWQPSAASTTTASASRDDFVGDCAKTSVGVVVLDGSHACCSIEVMLPNLKKQDLQLLCIKVKR